MARGESLNTVLIEDPGAAYKARHSAVEPAELASTQAAADVTYRALQPGDFESLRNAHFEMFPVDYEDAFFERVVHRQDGLESMAAVSREADGCEQLVGFVTARVFYLNECDQIDRQLLGLSHRLLDNDIVAYILTLGVSTQHRHKGIASALIQWVVQHAKLLKCRAVYLHVIAYNAAAISLYRRNCFLEVASRKDFYVLWSGRQPDPNREVYDAFLYASVIDSSIVRTPLSLLLIAFAPLRSLLQAVLACLPWSSPRGKYFGSADLPSALNLDVARTSSLRKAGSRDWLHRLFSRKGAVQ